MASGINYAKNPEYDGVSAYSVSTNDVTIPSGTTIIRGIYYMWNEIGFQSQGWMTNIPGSPLYMYFKDGKYVGNGSEWEDWAEEYLTANGNLNAVFEYWSLNYTINDWDNFYNAVGADSGCMDVDYSLQ